MKSQGRAARVDRRHPGRRPCCRHSEHTQTLLANMADAATDARGTKRAAPPSTTALQRVRAQVLAQMSAVSGKGVEELESAAAAAPEATVLELGLTSAQGVTLKGWVFKTLEAELTTFQLLKQPLNLVIEAIGACPFLLLPASIFFFSPLRLTESSSAFAS